MFYLVLILIIFIFIFSIKITIIIAAEPSTLKITIKLLKVIKISIVDKTKGEHGREKLTKTSDILKKKVPFSSKDLLSMVKELKEPLKSLLSKLQVELYTGFIYGLSSPDKTAISYGVINSLIYSLDLYLHKLMGKYKGSYTITPDLNKPSFDYKIKVSIAFRLFTLLPSIIKLLKTILKQKKLQQRKEGMKDGRASHRKLNENYNG